jgi:hypothetical protein
VNQAMAKNDTRPVRRIVARFLLEAMSNLPPQDTGVEGAIIWVSVGEFSGADLQHGPRVKVVPGNKITTENLQDAASVTITDPPRVLGTISGKIRRKVVAFVNQNRDTLLRYWNGELSTREMVGLIQRV